MTPLRLASLLHEAMFRKWRSVLVRLYANRFAKHGVNFSFDPWGKYSYASIFVGDDVTLGDGACLIATRSRITIGSHVMFGPEVVVRGGNHRFDLVGRWMKEVRDTEKRPEDDPGVVIEDDVWVGTRAIILAGVRVGRGSIVGAGAVVTHSVPPYAIVAGNPARVLRYRWDLDTILRHESLLYPANLRLGPGDLMTGPSKAPQINAAVALRA